MQPVGFTLPSFHLPTSNIDEHFVLTSAKKPKSAEVEKFLDNDQLQFERDTDETVENDHEMSGQEASEDAANKLLGKTPAGQVRFTFDKLYSKDSEFRASFDNAIENGLQINIRYQADNNSHSIVNGNVLQIDIKKDADIEKELTKVFNKKAEFEKKTVETGPSFDDVMASKDMSPKDFVEHMERLGVFSFSGPYADEQRADVEAILESPFMRKTVTSRLMERKGEEKFNFSTIGQGGGTISRPFDNYGTVLVSKEMYSRKDTKKTDRDEKDYSSVRMMAHEMLHAFLSIPDAPVINVADAIFNRELYGRENMNHLSDIAYGGSLDGTPFRLSDDFDVEKFRTDAREGKLDDKSHDEIFEAYGDAGVGEDDILYGFLSDAKDALLDL